MKFFIVLFLCFFSACFANKAASIGIGSNLTQGSSLEHQSLFSGLKNPAMTPLMIGDNESWRTAYLPSFSAGYELGDVNNFADDLDELIDLIDDPSLNADPVQEVLDRFNGVLASAGRNGYVAVSAHLHAPFSPLYYKSEFFGGSLAFDLNVSTKARVSVLDDPLEFNNNSYLTATSLYVKSGIQSHFGIAYGREIIIKDTYWSKQGDLYFGSKLNVYQIELSKQVSPIQELDGRDVADVLSDEYDQNLVSTTDVGLDVGIVWDADYYRLGFTLANIIAPSFEYGSVGERCELRQENTFSRSACESAKYFVEQKGRIKAQETHKKNTQATLDTLFFITDAWHISGSFELAKYDDLVGMENQWLRVSTGYEPKHIIAPSIRVGYQENKAGSGLASALVGFTLFNALSLDVEYGLDKVTADGTTVPRRAAFSLAFEEKF